MDSPPPPLLKLDPTPTFEEEVRDFPDLAAYSGSKPFDGEAAKTRIDTIARWLAIVWSVFLSYIILAQGFRSGLLVFIPCTTPERSFYLIRPFHLETAEFVAVVTTTTIAVFGFLVIVANHLFYRRSADKDGAD